MTQKPEKLVCSKRSVWEAYTEPQRGSRTSVKPALLLANHRDLENPSIAEKLVEHRDYSRHTYFNNAPNNTAAFTSRFYKPTKNIHPDYPITSQQSKPQLHSFHSKNQQPSFSVYPSHVDPTVKWSTNTQSSFVSVDDSQVNEQHDYNCWCESCITARSSAGLGAAFKPARPNTSPALGRSVIFHNNIVTFCNRCTMTPRLNDVSCGSSKCVVSPLITTEAGTSDTNLNTPQSPKSCRQNSILKKPQCDNYKNLTCFAKAWLDHKLTKSCVDNQSSCGNTEPTKCYRRSVCDPKRKMLYNEGISDDVAKQLCVTHKEHPPMHDINERTCSGLSIGRRFHRDKSDNYIPYSHKVNSKYHQNCKQEQPLVRKRSYVLNGVSDDECRTLRLESLVFRKVSAGACFSNSRCISLPKKLLTSEKNIEAFLKPKCPREYSL